MQYSIGDKIRRVREHQGMSISELARLSGVSRPYIYRIEGGVNTPTHDKVQRIADVLGVRCGITGDSIEEIPASLRTFAENHNVPYADVLMLNKIQYRGRKPEHETAWRTLYAVIKIMAE